MSNTTVPPMVGACSQCHTPTPGSALVAGRCPACRLQLRQKSARPPPKLVESAKEAVAKTNAVLAERTSLYPDMLEEKANARTTMEAEEQEAEQKRSARELVDAELARRALARRRLLPFVLRFNDKYEAGWVHQVVCAELERFVQEVVDKKSPRLMLFLPPRHGKSELVSRMLPAWFLGQYPELEVIAASHTTSLSMDFSRKVRGVFKSESFGQVFRSARISEDSQAAEHWRTSRGGGYTAVGVGSAVIGKGCSILSIDDPVSGSEDAESFKARETVKGWYQTEAYTRLAPGGGVLIIMQRWHDDDLAGWLLSQQAKGEGDEWRVVQFPAIATEDEPHRRAGEALHPERYPLPLLNKIKRNMTPRQWEALYQQNPVPDSGDVFMEEYFRFYTPEELPPLDTLQTYSVWDLAIGLKEANDFTAGFTAALTRNDDLYILDHNHGRWPAMEIVERMLDDQARWKCGIVGVERGHIQMTLGPYINKRRDERRQHGFVLHPLMIGRRDKLARARSIQGRMQQGRVYWPARAPWLPDVMREFMRFPNGTHDDRVDALAHLGLLLDDLVPTREHAPAPPKSWRDRLTAATGRHKSAMSA